MTYLLQWLTLIIDKVCSSWWQKIDHCYLWLVVFAKAAFSVCYVSHSHSTSRWLPASLLTIASTTHIMPTTSNCTFHWMEVTQPMPWIPAFLHFTPGSQSRCACQPSRVTVQCCRRCLQLATVLSPRPSAVHASWQTLISYDPVRLWRTAGFTAGPAAVHCLVSCWWPQPLQRISASWYRPMH